MDNLQNNPVSVAEAKAHFSELVARAEAGETISISKRGRLVARLSAGEQRKSINLSDLEELTATMPFQEQSAGEFIEELRQGSRY